MLVEPPNRMALPTVLHVHLLQSISVQLVGDYMSQTIDHLQRASCPLVWLRLLAAMRDLTCCSSPAACHINFMHPNLNSASRIITHLSDPHPSPSLHDPISLFGL